MNNDPLSYEFQACRFYRPGERYCNGSGLSYFTPDLERAFGSLTRYSTGGPDDAIVYACEIRQCGDTPRVIATGGNAGVTLAVAARSSTRAYAERYPPERRPLWNAYPERMAKKKAERIGIARAALNDAIACADKLLRCESDVPDIFHYSEGLARIVDAHLALLRAEAA